MRKILPLILIISSNLALANDITVTTSDLIIAQKWLSKNGGKHWKLLYNESGEKKYQWVITKEVYDDSIYITFKSGKEIDNHGKIIGSVSNKSDQFFTLVIDKKTYTLKRVDLGG